VQPSQSLFPDYQLPLTSENLATIVAPYTGGTGKGIVLGLNLSISNSVLTVSSGVFVFEQQIVVFPNSLTMPASAGEVLIQFSPNLETTPQPRATIGIYSIGTYSNQPSQYLYVGTITTSGTLDFSKRQLLSQVYVSGSDPSTYIPDLPIGALWINLLPTSGSFGSVNSWNGTSWVNIPIVDNVLPTSVTGKINEIPIASSTNPYLDPSWIPPNINVQTINTFTISQKAQTNAFPVSLSTGLLDPSWIPTNITVENAQYLGMHAPSYTGSVNAIPVGTSSGQLDPSWIPQTPPSTTLPKLTVNGSTTLNGPLIRTGDYLENANFLPNPTGALGLINWTTSDTSGWSVGNNSYLGYYFAYSGSTPSKLVSKPLTFPILTTANNSITISGFIWTTPPTSSAVFSNEIIPATTNYSCPSGYYLQGTYCIESSTAPIPAVVNYSCPQGYTLSGNQCVQTVTKAATVSYY